MSMDKANTVNKVFLYAGVMLTIASWIVLDISNVERLDYLMLSQSSISGILFGLTLVIFSHVYFKNINNAKMVYITFWLVMIFAILASLLIIYIKEELLSPLILENLFVALLFPMTFLTLSLRNKL